MTYYRDKYGYDPALCPTAASISNASLALPVGPHLTDGDVLYIIDAFRECIRETKS